MNTQAAPLASQNRRTFPKRAFTDAEMVSHVTEIERGEAWRVRSFSRPEISYVCRKAIDGGSLTCGCPATVAACVHIQAVNAYHAAILAAFDPFEGETMMTKAEEMADKLSTPVVDAEEWDPFAQAEAVVLTPEEVETLQPVRTTQDVADTVAFWLKVHKAGQITLRCECGANYESGQDPHDGQPLIDCCPDCEAKHAAEGVPEMPVLAPGEAYVIPASKPLTVPVARWIAPAGYYADLSALCDDMRI